MPDKPSTPDAPVLRPRSGQRYFPHKTDDGWAWGTPVGRVTARWHIRTWVVQLRSRDLEVGPYHGCISAAGPCIDAALIYLEYALREYAPAWEHAGIIRRLAAPDGV